MRDVTLRDGLQAERVTLPTAAKLRLLEALLGAGLRRIELTSFVRADAVPPLADAEALAAAAPRPAGVTYSALVPNLHGAARAAACPQVGEWTFFCSASEGHNRNNVGRSVAETLEGCRRVAEAHPAVPRSGVVATAFGCPFEGDVPSARVVEMARRFAEMGCGLILLADTVGYGNPRQVHDVCCRVREALPDGVRLGLHLHDTRGLALACALAGLQAGAAVLDGSIGGLGGCPFAPGATGNVATESLVYLLEEVGCATGVDLDGLIEAARLAAELLGRPLDTPLLRAGPRPKRGGASGAGGAPAAR